MPVEVLMTFTLEDKQSSVTATIGGVTPGLDTSAICTNCGRSFRTNQQVAITAAKADVSDVAIHCQHCGGDARVVNLQGIKVDGVVYYTTNPDAFREMQEIYRRIQETGFDANRVGAEIATRTPALRSLATWVHENQIIAAALFTAPVTAFAVVMAAVINVTFAASHAPQTPPVVNITNIVQSVAPNLSLSTSTPSESPNPGTSKAHP
jgi:hypothetical protein